MLIITVLFFTLFVQDISGHEHNFTHCWFCHYWFDLSVDQDSGWVQEHQEEFIQLGAHNFSMSAAHILHGLTVEAAMTSFNIRLTNQNGIPSMNPDLSADDSDALIANIPSRPNGYSSPGLFAFVDYMDHITNPNWVIRGSNLKRMLHAFHMQELWALARKAADGFSGVSEETCKGALDHANNGIDKAITVIFKYMKSMNTTLPGVPDTPLTWDDNGQSWKLLKAGLSFPQVGSGPLKSMGLYTQCLMRKFRQPQQPIEMDSCCESKTVGDHTYKLVFAGKVLSGCQNPCIYTRANKPGSQYCFAKGEQKVQCLG